MANEFKLKHGLAAGETVVIDAGGNWVGPSLPNNKLANNSVTINGTAVSLGGSLTTVYFSPTPPSDPQPGFEWTDSNSGIKYTYLNDGDSSQWVELGGNVSFGPTGPTGPQGAQGIQGPAGPNTINTASDVDATALSDGSVLVYATTTSKWTATLNLNKQTLDGGEF